MNISVSPGKLKGILNLPSSKSISHRVLICASLADMTSELVIRGMSDDIYATVDALRAFGAKIEIAEINGLSYIKIKPIDISKKQDYVCFDCKESGSTLRFLLPVADALFNKYDYSASDSLKLRPINALKKSLKESKNGIYEIDSSESSQYISGLLMMAPLKNADLHIKLKGKSVSMPYIELTVEVMKKFGIEVIKTDEGYFVKGNQHYKAVKDLKVESDWSNASFWITSCVLGSEIKLCGLDMNSKQGDKKILDIIDEISEGKIKAVFDNDILYFKKEDKTVLNSAVIDGRDIPDIIPELALILSVADGDSRIKNVSALRLKESNRLYSISKTLNSLGAVISFDENNLYIKGNRKIKGGMIDSYNDHRIVMLSAIASVLAEADIRLCGSEAVSKSYPSFFESFKSLGGIVNEQNQL